MVVHTKYGRKIIKIIIRMAVCAKYGRKIIFIHSLIHYRENDQRLSATDYNSSNYPSVGINDNSSNTNSCMVKRLDGYAPFGAIIESGI